jgi:hypothetical protein
MGKAILILILGSVLIFGVLNINTNKYIHSETINSVDYYADVQARNICNSMVQILLSQIADSSAFTTNGTKQTSMFGGTVNYSVQKVFFAGDTLLKVHVRSNYLGVEKEATAYSSPFSVGGWVPPVVRAAWTANADINRTISDMFIDGRDHALDGSIIPKKGVFGVSSSVKFNNTLKAGIGGTKDSIDYPMSFPENPKVIDQYAWGTNYPKTPDQVFGYTEGTLIEIAKSKKNGSQYVTDIKHLKFPLKGVSYVDLPANKSLSFDLKTVNNTPNTGLLIINAPNTSSKVTKITSKTPFVGMIITDYSFHHHFSILGAIVQLSPDLEMSSNCSGNKNHWVYFSREAIENYATGVVAQYSGQIGNNTGSGNTSTSGKIAGSGSRRIQTQHWLE